MWDFGGAKLISKIFLEENVQKKNWNKNIPDICTSTASKGGCIWMDLRILTRGPAVGRFVQVPRDNLYRIIGFLIFFLDFFLHFWIFLDLFGFLDQIVIISALWMQLHLWLVLNGLCMHVRSWTKLSIREKLQKASLKFSKSLPFKKSVISLKIRTFEKSNPFFNTWAGGRPQLQVICGANGLVPGDEKSGIFFRFEKTRSVYSHASWRCILSIHLGKKAIRRPPPKKKFVMESCGTLNCQLAVWIIGGWNNTAANPLVSAPFSPLPLSPLSPIIFWHAIRMKYWLGSAVGAGVGWGREGILYFMVYITRLCV